MCGVFGVYAPDRDVARLTYFGLFALQHRGQESAGIAVSDDGRLTALRDLGLVTQVFDEQKLHGLRGQVAIGHTRYSTTGSSQWSNAQPLVQHGSVRTVALGHNGNLVNATELREELRADGVTLEECHALADWRPSKFFDAKERATLAYVDEVTKNFSVPDAVFDELRKHYTDRQIVELTVLIATYNMHGHVLRALDIDLEKVHQQYTGS